MIKWDQRETEMEKETGENSMRKKKIKATKEKETK